MLKKLFSRKPLEKKETQPDPQTAALINAIRERSKEDPFVGAKLGAKEILKHIINAMKNENGVHIESLLCALGALAGYSCQANLRAQALAKGLPETAALLTVETTDGKKYFFGDPLNNALVSSQYSVWGLAAYAAQEAGAKELPDINEMFKYTSSVLGEPEFGMPRFPENHSAGDSPLNYLKALWPAIFPTVKLFCPKPSEWPILFGLAIQEAITMGKSVIAPDLSLKIVMESAIPISKIDPKNP